MTFSGHRTIMWRSKRCKHIHGAMEMFFMKHTSYSFNISSKNATFIPTWHFLFSILIFFKPIYFSIKVILHQFWVKKMFPWKFNLEYAGTFRDRPFNLKGGGDYGFLFRSEIIFRTTRELEYFFFFLAQNANFFSRI